jgi:hypothetical protein
MISSLDTEIRLVLADQAAQLLLDAGAVRHMAKKSAFEATREECERLAAQWESEGRKMLMRLVER